MNCTFALMKTVGDGTRVLNFLIDTACIFLLAYISFKTWNWYVLYWEYPAYNFGWFFFGGMFVYYTFFEILFLRTPGKWFTYSKITDTSGAKPGAWRILIRSLVRLSLIDAFFIPFFGKPLHDKLSGTELVEV